jgi:hypothetical protein
LNDRHPLQDIEEIRTLKARYIRLGDTQQWNELATLLSADFAARFEIAPALIRIPALAFVHRTSPGRRLWLTAERLLLLSAILETSVEV